MASSAAARSVTIGRSRTGCGVLRPTSRAPTKKARRNFICSAGVCVPTPPAILAPVAGIPVPVALNQKIDWFGTVRGRAGVLATPSVAAVRHGRSGLWRGQLQRDDRGGVDCISEHRRDQCRLDGSAPESKARSAATGPPGSNISMSISARVNGSFLTTISAFGGGVLSSQLQLAHHRQHRCGSASTTSSAARWWPGTEKNGGCRQKKARPCAGLFLHGPSAKQAPGLLALPVRRALVEEGVHALAEILAHIGAQDQILALVARQRAADAAHRLLGRLPA